MHLKVALVIRRVANFSSSQQPIVRYK